MLWNSGTSLDSDVISSLAGDDSKGCGCCKITELARAILLYITCPYWVIFSWSVVFSLPCDCEWRHCLCLSMVLLSKSVCLSVRLFVKRVHC